MSRTNSEASHDRVSHQPDRAGRRSGRQIVGPPGQPMIVKPTGPPPPAPTRSSSTPPAPPAPPAPPPHVHREQEGAFYVIDGALTPLLNEDTVTVDAGGFAVVPRGVTHAPSNSGAIPVRFFFVASPPMDDFFIEMSELVTATSGRPTPAKLREIDEATTATSSTCAPTSQSPQRN